MSENLKLGNVVYHKTMRENMCVVEINGNQCNCSWFDRYNQHRREWFNKNQLKFVRE